MLLVSPLWISFWKIFSLVIYFITIFTHLVLIILLKVLKVFFTIVIIFLLRLVIPNLLSNYILCFYCHFWTTLCCILKLLVINYLINLRTIKNRIKINFLSIQNSFFIKLIIIINIHILIHLQIRVNSLSQIFSFLQYLILI